MATRKSQRQRVSKDPLPDFSSAAPPKIRGVASSATFPLPSAQPPKPKKRQYAPLDLDSLLENKRLKEKKAAEQAELASSSSRQAAPSSEGTWSKLGGPASGSGSGLGLGPRAAPAGEGSQKLKLDHISYSLTADDLKEFGLDEVIDGLRSVDEVGERIERELDAGLNKEGGNRGLARFGGSLHSVTFPALFHGDNKGVQRDETAPDALLSQPLDWQAQCDSLLKSGLLLRFLDAQAKRDQESNSQNAAIMATITMLWKKGASMTRSSGASSLNNPAAQWDDDALIVAERACDALCSLLERGKGVEGCSVWAGHSEAGGAPALATLSYSSFRSALERTGYCHHLLEQDMWIAGLPPTGEDRVHDEVPKTGAKEPHPGNGAQGDAGDRGDTRACNACASLSAPPSSAPPDTPENGGHPVSDEARDAELERFSAEGNADDVSAPSSPKGAPTAATGVSGVPPFAAIPVLTRCMRMFLAMVQGGSKRAQTTDAGKSPEGKSAVAKGAEGKTAAESTKTDASGSGGRGKGRGKRKQEGQPSEGTAAAATSSGSQRVRPKRTRGQGSAATGSEEPGPLEAPLGPAGSSLMSDASLASNARGSGAQGKRQGSSAPWWVTWQWDAKERTSFALHLLRLLLVPECQVRPLLPLLQQAVQVLLGSLLEGQGEQGTGEAAALRKCSVGDKSNAGKAAQSRALLPLLFCSFPLTPLAPSTPRTSVPEPQQALGPLLQLLFRLPATVAPSAFRTSSDPLSSDSGKTWSEACLQSALTLLCLLLPTVEEPGNLKKDHGSHDSPGDILRDPSTGLLTTRAAQAAWERVEEHRGREGDLLKGLVLEFGPNLGALVVSGAPHTSSSTSSSSTGAGASRGQGDLEVAFSLMLLLDVAFNLLARMSSVADTKLGPTNLSRTSGGRQSSKSPGAEDKARAEDIPESSGGLSLARAEDKAREGQAIALFSEWLNKAAHLPTGDPRPEAPLFRLWAAYLSPGYRRRARALSLVLDY